MDLPQPTQPVSHPPLSAPGDVGSVPPNNEAETRSCFGCLFTGGLGCLGFGFGAVLGAIILAPALLSGFGTRLFEGFANAGMAGSMEFEGIGFAWTRPQDVRQVRIVNAEGVEILFGEGTLPSLLTMMGFGEEEWRCDFRVTSGSIDFDSNGVSNLTKAMTLENGTPLAPDFEILSQLPSGGVFRIWAENLMISREGESLGELHSAEFRYTHNPEVSDHYVMRCAFGSPEAAPGADQDISMQLAPGVFVARGIHALDDQGLHFHFQAQALPLTLLDVLPGGAGLRAALGEAGDVDLTLEGTWGESRTWQGGVEGEEGVVRGQVRIAEQASSGQRVVAELELPTAIVDQMLTLPWSLEDGMGPQVALRLLGDMVDTDQNWGMERAEISLLTPLQDLAVQMLLEGDVVRSVGGFTSNLELGLDDRFSVDVLAILLPWLEIVEKAEGSDPIRLTVGEFTLPMSGSELPASAEITFDLGEVRYRLHPLLSDGILRPGVGRAVYEDDLDPFKLSVRLGHVAYEDILLVLDDEECLIRGNMTLDTQELSLDVQFPASFLLIKGSEAAGDMAMSAVVRGDWKDPQLSFSSEMFETLGRQLDRLRGAFDDGFSP